MQTESQRLTSPTVRVHQASPTPTTTTSQSQPMLAQSQFGGGGWGLDHRAYLNLPHNVQQYHKRGSSSSSVASAGPPSPLDQQANIYHPRIATSDAHYSPSRYEFDFSSPQNSKTAQSLPDQMIFHQANPAFAGVDMRRIHSQDDRSYAAPSVSTMSHHNSPATPQTYEPDYLEDKFGGELRRSYENMIQYLPVSGNFNSMAYQQSLQDVFPEQQQQQQQQMFMKMNNEHKQLSMQGRIQAAQQDHLRTQSPTSNPSRKSPFRQSSPYVHQPVQQPRQMPQLQKQRTSISPKELMLDEHDVEDNQAPLFPESNFQHRRQPHNLSNFYTAAAFNTEPSVQIPQQYPFVSQASRSDLLADSTPDFTAPMLSMESTNEEEPSSQQSRASRVAPKSEPRKSLSRPVDTSSDAGTYSCTYHGCPERFDSPAKLQKHKREGHRQHESGNATAARNSQAGPHRCDRINPSTGKPCASVFSRPYDLTRHEDTIHNNKKAKIRCYLCQGEDKLFSRADALNRHMRVVHPDVQVTGRQKRSKRI